VPKLRFGDLKIGVRLALGFGVAVALMFVLVGIGWSTADSTVSTALQANAQLHWNTARMQLQTDGTRVGLDENSVAADYEARVPAAGDLASFQSDRAQFLADFAAMAKDSFRAQEAGLVHQVTAAFDTYVSLSTQANRAFGAGTPAGLASGEKFIGELSVGSVLKPIEQLTKIQHDEAAAGNASAVSSAHASRNVLLIVGLVALVLAVACALAIIRSITKPLAVAVQALEASAAGDLKTRANISSADELGQMANALNKHLDALRTLIVTVKGFSDSLASASEQLSSVSHHLSTSAQGAASEATMASAAAEQVSSNVQTVAASAEELSGSIREIARSASEASRVASQGVSVAQATNDTVARLSQSSGEIDEVVKVITSIAQQTNLLALNATIEAARAGEAGRGFAIVANEVKELAKETAKATEDIAAKIEAIQGDSKAAIEAIGQIDNIMGGIHQAQATIASAVEEQTATTNEIGRSVGEAATGAGGIAQSIAQVAKSAQDTNSGAAQAKLAAEELARMASELEQALSGLRI
jgi:methyl-accepting chemotaxis protein